jgi:hypothetical protein
VTDIRIELKREKTLRNRFFVCDRHRVELERKYRHVRGVTRDWHKVDLERKLLLCDRCFSRGLSALGMLTP